MLAGAGSGKTRVITHRLARLVASGADPRTIAAVTFTNKAAEEMRERAQALAGGAALGSFVGTFHSLVPAFPAPPLPRGESAAAVLDRGLLRPARPRQRGHGGARDLGPTCSRPTPCGRRISPAKNALVTAERFDRPADGLCRRADRAGLRPLREEARGVGGPRLRRPDRPLGAALLRDNAAVAAEERRRIRHLLIDEYQDTNSSQDALVKLLGEAADSLCAVGDEDQAIYRWRGAEIEHILRFEEDFPGARVIALEANYRSTAKILEAASGLVVAQPPAPREAAAGRTAATARASGSGVSKRTGRSRGRGARDRRRRAGAPGEVADPLPHQRPVPALRGRAGPPAKIPYVVVGGMKFYERAEVKDVLAYLRLAARPEDDLAFRRVVNVPARGIGAATLDRLAEAARESGRSWWEVSANPPGLPERARTALARFRAVVSDLHEKAAT